MPKKPTRPYGSLIFSKNGKVRKDISQLPDDKAGQEAGVAEAFLRLATQLKSAGILAGVMHRMLPENDHDFAIETGEGGLLATVQVAEVTLGSYTRRILREEYVNDPPREVILGAPDKYLAVDSTKFANSVTKVVKGKLDKHYAKPASGELWLVIFSVSGHLLGSAYHKGIWKVAEPIHEARKLLGEMGSGPFDKVFFFNMQTRPELIWPPIDDRSEPFPPDS